MGRKGMWLRYVISKSLKWLNIQKHYCKLVARSSGIKCIISDCCRTVGHLLMKHKRVAKNDLGVVITITDGSQWVNKCPEQNAQMHLPFLSLHRVPQRSLKERAVRCLLWSAKTASYALVSHVARLQKRGITTTTTTTWLEWDRPSFKADTPLADDKRKGKEEKDDDEY